MDFPWLGWSVGGIKDRVAPSQALRILYHCVARHGRVPMEGPFRQHWPLLDENEWRLS